MVPYLGVDRTRSLKERKDRRMDRTVPFLTLLLAKPSVDELLNIIARKLRRMSLIVSSETGPNGNLLLA